MCSLSFFFSSLRTSFLFILLVFFHPEKSDGRRLPSFPWKMGKIRRFLIIKGPSSSSSPVRPSSPPINWVFPRGEVYTVLYIVYSTYRYIYIWGIGGEMDKEKRLDMCLETRVFARVSTTVGFVRKLLVPLHFCPGVNAEALALVGSR